MAVTMATINNQLVLYEEADPHRWLDAWGPDVCKMLEHFVNTPFSGADQLAGWLNTEVDAGAGDTTATLVAGSVGGELALKTAENESDGANVQLLGEAFSLAARYPTYIGARFKSSDADQTEITLGLCITDTTLADSDVNWPDDEFLTPSMACIAGAAAVGGKTLTVDWFNCIQLQAV